MTNLYHVLKRPVVTEKTSEGTEANNTVAFEVDRRATKQEIRHAVQTMFKVSVVNVATMNKRGKLKRLGGRQGRRPDWKKAVVKLKAGDRIEFFQGV